MLTDTRVAGDDSVCYTYCYTAVLPAGEKTSPLFETVTMPDFLTNKTMQALDGELTILVKADAIQSQSFQDYQAAFSAFDQQTGA